MYNAHIIKWNIFNHLRNISLYLYIHHMCFKCTTFLCKKHKFMKKWFLHTKNSQMLWPTANTPYQFASSHCATKAIASLSNWQLNGLKASKPQRRKSSITNFTSDSPNIMSGHVVGQHGYLCTDNCQFATLQYLGQIYSKAITVIKLSCPCFFMSSCSEGYSIHCL